MAEPLLDFLDDMRRLRRDCPWDREQTAGTIVPHTVEEAYEVADAAAAGDPAKLLDGKLAARRAIDANSQVSLPGDRLLERSVQWSKQNLAESVQESRDLEIRTTNAGKNYPAPQGTVAKARWIGAGWPDYPWLFATDGEYTGFAAVASGQFTAIKDHLRALRDVS